MVRGILAGSVLLGVAGCTAAVADRPADAAAGRRVAQAICAECHAIAEGEASLMPRGGPPFAVIASNPDFSDARLRGFLQDTHRPMPNPLLSWTEREAVIAYIRSQKP
jgi:mono/diheme cytochrome c family protein